MELPIEYKKANSVKRRRAREQYIKDQNGLCWFCQRDIFELPPPEIRTKPIKWELFPVGFRQWPIHLQHDHSTGLTEGAVHMYCNAVMWQYYNR